MMSVSADGLTAGTGQLLKGARLYQPLLLTVDAAGSDENPEPCVLVNVAAWSLAHTSTLPFGARLKLRRNGWEAAG